MSASVTVIVPTYREAANIPDLVARLQGVRDRAGIGLELLLMDDDSQDGSEELVNSLGLPWVRIVTRKADRGLSKAVLEGVQLSTRDILVVMDADLSHPPEKIPEMIAALDAGAEVAVGSRFTEGGSTADDWGVFRWLNSRIATILAFPLTKVKDPMSGFFAIRRATVAAGERFDPIGYKILLELIIKCRCRIIVEVPIRFDNRLYGESKLSLQEQLRYIRHLRRLYIHKYGTWLHLAQFLCVGASGVVVNLIMLTLLLRWNVAGKAAVAIAIFVSMIWNFVLNRRFTFSYARDRSMVKQFVGYVAGSSVGILVNYFTTISVWQVMPYKQLAAMVGILAGTLFNFGASRFLVFRAKHIQK